MWDSNYNNILETTRTKRFLALGNTQFLAFSPLSTHISTNFRLGKSIIQSHKQAHNASLTTKGKSAGNGKEQPIPPQKKTSPWKYSKSLTGDHKSYADEEEQHDSRQYPMSGKTWRKMTGDHKSYADEEEQHDSRQYPMLG